MEDERAPEEEEEEEDKEERWSRMFSVPGCWRFMRSKSYRPGNETSPGRRVGRARRDADIRETFSHDLRVSRKIEVLRDTLSALLWRYKRRSKNAFLN